MPDGRVCDLALCPVNDFEVEWSQSDNLYEYIDENTYEDGLSDLSMFSRSPSVFEEEEDLERWRPSDPPTESFSDAEGANENGEWRFEIIGEEVDHKNEVLLEVRWDDWKREDGTKTTWNELISLEEGSRQWMKEQGDRRRKLARESFEISVISTFDIHNTETYLRREACEEKLRLFQEEQPPSPLDQLERLMNERGYCREGSRYIPSQVESSQGSSSSSYPIRANQRASTRQQTEVSIASSMRSSSKLSVRSSSMLSTIIPLSSSSFATTPARSSAPAPSPKLPPATAATSQPTNHSPSSSPPPPPPEVVPLSETAKGKRPLRFSEDGGLNVFPPSAVSLSEKAKGKLPMRFSERESSDELMAIPRQPTPRRLMPYVLCTPYSVIIERRMKSEQRDEDEGLRKGPPRKKMKYVDSSSLKSVRRSADSDSEDELQSSQPRPSPPLPASAPTPSKSISSPSKTSPTAQRLQLQTKWTNLAAKEGAAAIYFSNIVDDEAVPLLDSNFCYMESGYKFAPGIEKPAEEFLSSCSCISCHDPAQRCQCQDLYDDKQALVPAYTAEGLFSFQIYRAVEVIECNKLCKCTALTCQNRVSQKPRDVPVEVFKTAQRGWGVRPLKDVKRGQVLGIYTGLVMRREEARAVDDSSYCFDLDGDEADGNVPMHDLYTVDSRVHGNWMRFINHSCSPNLEVYLVVHDVPPGTGLPFLAFTATDEIPAKTEFTFDYDPGTARRLALAATTGLETEALKGRKKGQSKRSATEDSIATSTSMSIPEGAMACLCGSSQCRKYFR